MTTGSVPKRRVPVTEGHAALLTWARTQAEDPDAAAALPRAMRATVASYSAIVSSKICATGFTSRMRPATWPVSAMPASSAARGRPGGSGRPKASTCPSSAT